MAKNRPGTCALGHLRTDTMTLIGPLTFVSLFSGQCYGFTPNYLILLTLTKLNIFENACKTSVQRSALFLYTCKRNGNEILDLRLHIQPRMDMNISFLLYLFWLLIQ